MTTTPPPPEATAASAAAAAAAAGEGEESTTPDNSYFEPLDLCDLIFHQPFRVFRRNAICFLTIALFASGLRALLAFVFDAVNGPNYGADYGTNAEVAGAYNLDVNTNQEFDFWVFLMSFVNSLILFVVTCLSDGAVVKVVADIYAGQAITSPSPVAYFGTVAFKAVPLVGSCLVVSFATTLACLFLMPIMFAGRPGGLFLLVCAWAAIFIYVSLVTFVMFPAIVVEHKGIFDSIQRSFQLTQGHLSKTFVVVLLYSLLKSLLSMIVVSATISYEATGNMAVFYTRAVLCFCINTVFIAIMSILKSIIYFNIRIIDEQLTQDKLVEEMGDFDAYIQMDEKNNTIEMEKPTIETPAADKEVV